MQIFALMQYASGHFIFWSKIMKQQIENIKQEFAQELQNATTVANFQELRVKYVGKSGVVTGLLRQIKDVAPQDRASVGNMINDLRKGVEVQLAETEEKFAQVELENKLKAEQIDISLLNGQQWGTRHPIDKVKDEIIDLFKGIGFEVCEGPELETDYYNFQALNLPLEHPSRDMQDTFYFNDNILLRTQTSAMQARLMEKKGPPIKMLCPGKVFRADSDASHSPVFHQIEGLVVDTDITLRDLKGTLEYVAQRLFDEQTQVRFRPSYFPFTEPSVEVDLTCCNCHGKGCSLCKGTGWIEVLGAGMVNPFVLENCGIDSNKYTGYAFGFGIERMAMIKYGIPDIRLFFENDIRFLKQFKK